MTNELIYRSVIALDGPAGAGKSSVARKVADRLGYIHADSGAIYRLLTLALMERLGFGNSVDHFAADVASALTAGQIAFDNLDCRVVIEEGRQINRLGGRDVGDEIRTLEVTERIWVVADLPAAREEVNRLLRDFATQTELVVDGRDIGTVVFPDTPWKFYIDASSQVRAERRLRELELRGQSAAFETLKASIEKRDDEDRNRPLGALRRHPDAIWIDTDRLDLDGVVTRLFSHMQIEF